MEGPERNYTERTQHLRYDCNTLVDEVERDPHRVRPVQICDTTADDGLGGQIWRGGRWSLERWRGRFLESCTVTSLRSSWMEVVKLETHHARPVGAPGWRERRRGAWGGRGWGDVEVQYQEVEAGRAEE